VADALKGFQHFGYEFALLDNGREPVGVVLPEAVEEELVKLVTVKIIFGVMEKPVDEDRVAFWRNVGKDVEVIGVVVGGELSEYRDEEQANDSEAVLQVFVDLLLGRVGVPDVSEDIVGKVGCVCKTRAYNRNVAEDMLPELVSDTVVGEMCNCAVLFCEREER